MRTRSFFQQIVYPFGDELLDFAIRLTLSMNFSGSRFVRLGFGVTLHFGKCCFQPLPFFFTRRRQGGISLIGQLADCVVLIDFLDNFTSANRES